MTETQSLKSRSDLGPTVDSKKQSPRRAIFYFCFRSPEIPELVCIRLSLRKWIGADEEAGVERKRIQDGDERHQSLTAPTKARLHLDFKFAAPQRRCGCVKERALHCLEADAELRTREE